MKGKDMKLKVGMVGISLLLVGGAFAVGQDIKDAPDGASIKLFPDGAYQITAVGTGTYDFNDPDDIKDARKEAEMRAKAAIAKFLKEDISTQEGMGEASKKVKSVSSDGQNQSTSVSKTSVKTAMESIRNSASALLTGVVVLQDAKIPSGNGGTYKVMVGVSSKTTAAANAAANGIAGSLNDRGGASAPAVGGATAAAPAAENTTSTAAPAGLPPVPEGWIVCVGMGSERKTAVQQALVEGISQVYGQMLQNDERMSERMKKIKTNANILGKELNATAKTSVKEQQSSTLTKTAGFVREYRVIQVVPKDGNQEATVYAYIVNPRAGGTVALMVCKPTMTIEDKSTVYQLGPKTRMSGAEVAKAIQFALPNGLAKANKFLVLNDKSLGTVIENKATTDAMVATGLANASELMQAGQGLTPDFSIRSEIKDIAYSKKLGQDKKTKKFGQVYKMSIKLDVTLMNDRTGQAVKSDMITLALDNDEIKGRLEEDEDADLLQAALSKLAESIETWIGKK
jgi:hypothetical protein